MRSKQACSCSLVEKSKACFVINPLSFSTHYYYKQKDQIYILHKVSYSNHAVGILVLHSNQSNENLNGEIRDEVIKNRLTIEY